MRFECTRTPAHRRKTLLHLRLSHSWPVTTRTRRTRCFQKLTSKCASGRREHSGPPLSERCIIWDRAILGAECRTERGLFHSNWPQIGLLGRGGVPLSASPEVAHMVSCARYFRCLLPWTGVCPGCAARLYVATYVSDPLYQLSQRGICFQ